MATGIRVRLNYGIFELPEDTVAVALAEDTVMRWRTVRTPPPGVKARLGNLDVGAAVCVERGGVWEDGVVLGSVIRPVAGRRCYRVDGDVADYGSPEAAEREHGPLERGEPLPAPPPAGADQFAVGEPLTRAVVWRRGR